MTMHKFTLDYLTKRATESGVSMTALKLELDPEDTTSKDVHQVTVIYDGALDEEFYLDGLYAVNVCDWLAETCRDEARKDADHPDWEIILAEYVYEDAGPVRYRVSSES